MADKKPNGKNTQDPRYKHLDIDETNAASSMDFTGLIPANPQFGETLDAYRDIRDFGNDTSKDSND